MLEMRLLPCLLFVLAFPSRAEIYTWRQGASLRYSNYPPSWYRIDRPVRGPRVVVTQGKRLVDDTALSMADRLRLRPVLRPARKN